MMTPVPTLWWFRPASSAARVGLQSASDRAVLPGALDPFQFPDYLAVGREGHVPGKDVRLDRSRRWRERESELVGARLERGRGGATCQRQAKALCIMRVSRERFG